MTAIANYTLMNNNANAMMFNNDHHHLTWAEIESLSDEDYALFLAYGDTLTDQTTVPAGAGGDQLWDDEATRLLEAAEREDILLGKRLRVCFYNRYAPFPY